MASKFIEIGQWKNSPLVQNSLFTLEEADMADSFFIGSVGKFMQWSVSQEKVTKDFGHIITGDIYAMVQTSDKNYLFVSDLSGS
jgi:hypothetical protein